ncbi:MAG: hypothetical protein LBQ69_06745, partial [Treponema sp.]|nr:hypothetical protein [Treponema sp.]
VRAIAVRAIEFYADYHSFIVFLFALTVILIHHTFQITFTFLSKKTEGMGTEQKIRMIQCTAIRFMRKIQLSTSIRLPRGEVKQILGSGG